MLCHREQGAHWPQTKIVGFVSIGDPFNLVRYSKWDFSRTPNHFERQPVHKTYQQQYIGSTSHPGSQWINNQSINFYWRGRVTKLSEDSPGKQGWGGYPKDWFANTPYKVGPCQLSAGYKSIYRGEKQKQLPNMFKWKISEMMNHNQNQKSPLSNKRWVSYPSSMAR